MKIILYPAISLDGFIAKTDGDSDWVTEEDELLFASEVKKAGCVIVGRTTYEQYKGTLYPVAEAMNFVCTSSPPLKNDQADVTYLSGSVAHILSCIDKAGFSRAVLSGGGDTNGRFAIAQTIDEMLVSIYPLTLGAGLKLFGNWNPYLKMDLLATERLQQSVIRNRYRIRY
jgi:dihydrofolate reductase